MVHVIYGMMLGENSVIKNYKEEITSTIQKIQHRYSRLKTIKEKITDKDGKAKDINQIEDIDFEDLETGMLESRFYENLEDEALFDDIYGEETENTSLCLKKLLNRIKQTDKEENMTNVEIALQTCNTLLEKYQKDIEDIEETKRKIIESYSEAKENYVNKENIFDPNGIVPATIKPIRKLTHEEEEILDKNLRNLGISFNDGTSQPQNKGQEEGITIE